MYCVLLRLSYRPVRQTGSYGRVGRLVLSDRRKYICSINLGQAIRPPYLSAELSPSADARVRNRTSDHLPDWCNSLTGQWDSIGNRSRFSGDQKRVYGPEREIRPGWHRSRVVGDPACGDNVGPPASAGLLSSFWTFLYIGNIFTSSTFGN